MLLLHMSAEVLSHLAPSAAIQAMPETRPVPLAPASSTCSPGPCAQTVAEVARHHVFSGCVMIFWVIFFIKNRATEQFKDS